MAAYPEAHARVRAGGLDSLMDRCVEIEHVGLFGGLQRAGVNTGVISVKRPGCTMADRPFHPETLTIPAGQIPGAATGTPALPIYETTSFVFDSADQAASRSTCRPSTEGQFDFPG